MDQEKRQRRTLENSREICMYPNHISNTTDSNNTINETDLLQQICTNVQI